MSDYEKKLARAAKLCSSAEKCSYNIKEKLIAWGLNETEAETAISYLEENNYLNDNRYAQFFVKDKLKINHWGRVKIAYALRRKRIQDNIIEHALETITEPEYNEILDQLLAAKIRASGDIHKASNKAKVIRFAAQRGFTLDEIFNAIKRLEKD